VISQQSMVRPSVQHLADRLSESFLIGPGIDQDLVAIAVRTRTASRYQYRAHRHAPGHRAG